MAKFLWLKIYLKIWLLSFELETFQGKAGAQNSSDEDDANLKKSTTLIYQSTGETVVRDDQNATAIRNVDTEEVVDQRFVTYS